MNGMLINLLCVEVYKVDGFKFLYYMLFIVLFLRFVQFYKEFSMISDQKKYLCKFF